MRERAPLTAAGPAAERVSVAAAQLEGDDAWLRVEAMLAIENMAHAIAEMPVDEASQREQLALARRLTGALASAAEHFKQDVTVQAPAEGLVMGRYNISRLNFRGEDDTRQRARDAMQSDPAAKVDLRVPRQELMGIVAEALVLLNAWRDPECGRHLDALLGSWSGSEPAALRITSAVGENRVPPTVLATHLPRWLDSGLPADIARPAMKRMSDVPGAQDAVLERLLQKPVTQWSSVEKRQFVELKPSDALKGRVLDRVVQELAEPRYGGLPDSMLLSFAVLHNAAAYTGAVNAGIRRQLVEAWPAMNDTAAAMALWVLMLDADREAVRTEIRGQSDQLLRRYLKADYFGPMRPMGAAPPQTAAGEEKPIPLHHVHDAALVAPIVAPLPEGATLAALRAAVLTPVPPRHPMAATDEPVSAEELRRRQEAFQEAVRAMPPPSWITHNNFGPDETPTKLLVNRRAVISLLLRSTADREGLITAFNHPVVNQVLRSDAVFSAGLPRGYDGEPRQKLIENVKTDDGALGLALRYPRSAFAHERAPSLFERFAELDREAGQEVRRAAVRDRHALQALAELPGVREAVRRVAGDATVEPAARVDAAAALLVMGGDGAVATTALAEWVRESYPQQPSTTAPRWLPPLDLLAEADPAHPELDRVADQMRPHPPGPFYVWVLDVIRGRTPGAFPVEACRAALRDDGFADALAALARRPETAAAHAAALTSPALLSGDFSLGVDGRQGFPSSRNGAQALIAWFGLVDRLDLHARGFSEVATVAPAD